MAKRTSKQKPTENSLFDMFDKNGNESISRQELTRGLRLYGLNPTEKDVDQIYHDMGLRRGEAISLEAFKTYEKKYAEKLKNKTGKEFKESMEQSFKVFDKDKSGTIDVNELKEAMKTMGDKLTDEEVKEMFKGVDTNKDGKIDINEFIAKFSKDKKR